LFEIIINRKSVYFICSLGSIILTKLDYPKIEWVWEEMKVVLDLKHKYMEKEETADTLKTIFNLKYVLHTRWSLEVAMYYLNMCLLFI